MDKVEYLAKILGSEEKAKAFVDKAGLKQKVLTDANIESKEVTTPEPKVETPAPPPTPEPKQEEADQVLSKVMKELDIEGLNAFVSKAKDAMEKVEVLEELVQKLQGKQDEKLAEILTPPVSKFSWTQDKRASTSDENVVTDKEKEDAAPGVPKDYWLSEITKTTPIKVS